MKILEKTLICLAVAGLIMDALGLTWNIIAVFAILGLMFLYTFLGFALFNDVPLRAIFKKNSFSGINAKGIVKAVFSGMAICIGLVGILFTAFRWPGAFVELVAGFIVLTPVIILSAVRYRQNKSTLSKNILLRAIPVFIIAFVYFTHFI